jgi:hypothetical protein
MRQGKAPDGYPLIFLPAQGLKLAQPKGINPAAEPFFLLTDRVESITTLSSATNAFRRKVNVLAIVY